MPSQVSSPPRPAKLTSAQIDAQTQQKEPDLESVKEKVKLKSDPKPIGQEKITEADVLLSPPPVITAELTSQQLSQTAKERRVPSSRIGRAATFASEYSKMFCFEMG